MPAAVVCPVLTAPENGDITYSEESSSPLGFIETAAYSCNTGFGLTGGDTVRTCVGTPAPESSGGWTGIAPICQGELAKCQAVSVCVFTWIFLNSDHLPFSECTNKWTSYLRY